MVWADSWPSIVGAGCGLICVGAGDEWARKVYALRDLQGVKCGPHGGKKSKTKSSTGAGAG
jgi:hypothetical protein